jgi:quercetin dioxygenase-like cupin family protein
MDIKRSGSQPSGKGPAEYFTGTVRIDPLFEAPDPARVRGISVTSEPGAREAWHSHPLGQTLIVTAGCGRVQRWGGSNRGHSAGGRDLVPAGRETLARRNANHGHDPRRHSGTARRQDRRLDGTGKLRTIPGLIVQEERSDLELKDRSSENKNRSSANAEAQTWKQ